MQAGQIINTGVGRAWALLILNIGLMALNKTSLNLQGFLSLFLSLFLERQRDRREGQRERRREHLKQARGSVSQP